MNKLDPRAMPDTRTTSGRALFAYGMWLRGGFIGLSLLVAGVVSVVDGSARPVNALAAAVVGATLGAWSWRRARVALDRVAAVVDASTVATEPAATRGRPQMLAQQGR